MRARGEDTFVFWPTMAKLDLGTYLYVRSRLSWRQKATYRPGTSWLHTVKLSIDIPPYVVLVSKGH